MQGPVFCLGDLFDTWNNEEAVIDDAFRLLDRVNRVIAGNHDLPNREGKVSSLQLIHHALPSPKVILAQVDQVGFDFWEDTEHLVMFVPHHALQSMFEAALIEAEPFAMTQRYPHKILCLHCNYDFGFELTDSTLNLTQANAKILLNTSATS